ncbi:MAG: PA0069 family radical SAM protein [Gammaproteobacteria bacterium]|nr:MAG: PA0069 family radical SAM protein [Gammaproteobacteria bacterium]
MPAGWTRLAAVTAARHHVIDRRKPAGGRGASSNPRSRFDTLVIEPVHDGWDSDGESDAALKTELIKDDSKSVIARNSSPDVPFDQSINPYRGCEHGCAYCYARPTHAWLGLSPGLDFETKILFKPDAAHLLREELSRPGYRCSTITLGTNTDPYQPAESTLKLTRSVLEVLSDCRHPVSIVTKSALIERDIDLLAPMANLGLASVMVSVTTLDDDLKRRLEPRTASPSRRLKTIRTLSEASIPVGVLVAPVIPAINDQEIEAILAASGDAGACNAAYILLRLPHEVAPLFEEWLRLHYPRRSDKVMSLVSQARGGRLNDPRFGHRMSGHGPWAEMIRQRFRKSCRRAGIPIGEHRDLDTTAFSRPPAQSGQLDLI